MDFHVITGIAIVTVLAFLLVTILIRAPLSHHASFSQHAAQTRAFMTYYALIFLITFIPLLWLSVGYLFPRYGFPPVASILIYAAVITQITCTLIPEGISSRRTFLHRTFAGISAVSFVALNGVFAAETMRPSVILGLALMVISGLWMILGKQRYILIAQTVLYGGFFVSYMSLLIG